MSKRNGVEERKFGTGVDMARLHMIDSLDLRWFRISTAEVQDSVAGVNGVADWPAKPAQQPFHKKRASGMDLFRISIF